MLERFRVVNLGGSLDESDTIFLQSREWEFTTIFKLPPLQLGELTSIQSERCLSVTQVSYIQEPSPGIQLTNPYDAPITVSLRAFLPEIGYEQEWNNIALPERQNETTIYTIAYTVPVDIRTDPDLLGRLRFSATTTTLCFDTVLGALGNLSSADFFTRRLGRGENVSSLLDEQPLTASLYDGYSEQYMRVAISMWHLTVRARREDVLAVEAIKQVIELSANQSLTEEATLELLAKVWENLYYQQDEISLAMQAFITREMGLGSDADLSSSQRYQQILEENELLIYEERARFDNESTDLILKINILQELIDEIDANLAELLRDIETMQLVHDSLSEELIRLLNLGGNARSVTRKLDNYVDSERIPIEGAQGTTYYVETRQKAKFDFIDWLETIFDAIRDFFKLQNCRLKILGIAIGKGDGFKLKPWICAFIQKTINFFVLGLLIVLGIGIAFLFMWCLAKTVLQGLLDCLCCRYRKKH